MIGVNGWLSANQRNGSGIEPVGTNPLPKNGKSSSGIGRLLAVSTLLVSMPSATAIHVRARALNVRRPAAASHPKMANPFRLSCAGAYQLSVVGPLKGSAQ